jgi:hypothetical protein
VNGDAGSVSDDAPVSTTRVTLSTQTPLGFRATCDGDLLGGMNYTFDVFIHRYSTTNNL